MKSKSLAEYNHVEQLALRNLAYILRIYIPALDEEESIDLIICIWEWTNERTKETNR